MNLFILDEDPIKSAEYLDDARLVKLILEAAQMLSHAAATNGAPTTYKALPKQYQKHPVTLWVCRTRGNYINTLDRMKAMLQVYTLRFHKVHKCASVVNELELAINNIPEGKLEPYQNSAANGSYNISFKHMTDVVEAYRLYIQYRWKFTDKNPRKNRTSLREVI